MHVDVEKLQQFQSVNDIHALISDDMKAVNELISRSLHSEVVLIGQLSNYIINSGGKRLRPVLVLLSAQAFSYQGSQHINLAAIIEFIHTATLLHDDVVDASELRRGNDTANAIWGNEASVLVGDFLYSRAFEMMVELGDMRIMEILAHATNTIAEGEVMQLLNINEPDTTEQQYLNVIYCKTARLFEAGCQLGALVAQQDMQQVSNMAEYGKYLGTAFQLIDDVIDYTSSAEETGKNMGDDLAEGKPTLPLIHAMQHGNPDQVKVIRQVIEQGGRDRIVQVRQIIESTGSIAYTAELARNEAAKARQAIADIPESIHKSALYALTDFAVERSF